MKKFLLLSQFILLLLIIGYGRSLLADTPTPDAQLREQIRQAFITDAEAVTAAQPMAATPCTAGFAGVYPCDDIDLLAFIPLTTFGGTSKANDIWGWTDPDTGREYAIMGRRKGTEFIDITDPENPVRLGELPKPLGILSSSWRDIKVYQDHAFIVSEALNHGMQIFDLTQLRTVITPTTFTETAHYTQFGRAHNLVINEESGYAYAVGSQNGTHTCGAGLHMVNIISPTNPSFAGCFSSDGYTHDAQCVIYNGPDSDYLGHEVCFNFNEDTVTVVDVTDKSNPIQISRTGYSGSRYTHQGWLTENHTYLLVDDELDELNNGHNTHTYIWDMTDLDNPDQFATHVGPTTAMDHNQYVKGKYLYQANYRAGLRILDISDIANGNLTEVAYFDIYQTNNNPNSNGAWSTYPYYESGVVVVSGIEQGFFVLRPTALDTTILTPTAVSTLTIQYDDTTATLDWSDTNAEVYDVWGSTAPFFTPGSNCAFAPASYNCTVQMTATAKDTNTEAAQFYAIVPRNADGGINTTPTQWVGFMDFTIQGD